MIKNNVLSWSALYITINSSLSQHIFHVVFTKWDLLNSLLDFVLAGDAEVAFWRCRPSPSHDSESVAGKASKEQTASELYYHTEYYKTLRARQANSNWTSAVQTKCLQKCIECFRKLQYGLLLKVSCIWKQTCYRVTGVETFKMYALYSLRFWTLTISLDKCTMDQNISNCLRLLEPGNKLE